MKRLQSDGFTLIELLVFIVVLMTIAFLAVTNIRDLNARHHDETNKEHINAVFYQLESFHETNGYYPEKIDAKTLKGIDPESLKDTNNVPIDNPDSQYSYAPHNCDQGKCKSFDLKTNLQKEAPFTKQSLVQ